MLRQARLQGRIIAASDEAAAKLSALDDLYQAKTSQSAEQARIIQSHKKRYRALEEKFSRLARVHEACPSSGGISKADHDRAIAAKESESDQLRQQIAGLQESLAAQQRASDQRHQQEVALLQMEFQRRLDAEVEQVRQTAREEGRQEARQATIAEAEMLFATYMTSREGVGAPLVIQEASSSVPVPEAPVDPLMIDSLVSDFDRLNLGTPTPEESSLATVDAVGAIVQASVNEDPALVAPAAEAEPTSLLAVGAAVLAQGLFSQTAERDLLADALNLGVSSVQLDVEQMPDPEVSTEAVDALIAEEMARSRTAIDDHARADGENSQVLPACERQTPPDNTDLPDFEEDDAPMAGDEGEPSGVRPTFHPFVIQARQRNLAQARSRVEELERHVRRSKKELNTGIKTGRFSGSAVDERQDLLVICEANLTAARVQLAICQAEVDELQLPEDRSSQSSVGLTIR